MSTIRAAFTNVKNFLVGIVQQQHQEENLSPDNFQQQQTSGFGGGTTRKRAAGPGSIFEPEITDDEDDVPVVGLAFKSSIDNPKAKRIRIEFESTGRELSEMSSNRSDQASQRYVTRGSGVSPTIKGLSKQPWEFSFRNKKEAVAGPGLEIEGGFSGSSSKGPSQEDAFKMGNRPCGGPRTSVPTSTTSRASCSKNVEVITIDDDEQPCSSTKYFNTQQKENERVSSPKRTQLDFLKPRISSNFKSTTKRDSNPLSKCLTIFSKNPSSHLSASRFKEKDRYKQLLMNYKILSNTGIYATSTALTKSKVSPDRLQVMYSKFGPSPTQGTVSLRYKDQPFATSPPNRSQELLSPADRYALVPVPKLFSTPQNFEPLPAPPKREAISYKVEPEIVDLEEEPSTSAQVESCISPITPVISRGSYKASTPVKSPVVGNFQNLEEAISQSPFVEQSTSKDGLEAGILALEDSPKKEDDLDISIVAEKLINASRSKSVNTLALEQSSCPYVDKKWLNDSKTSYRENQKHRDQRIQEEAETLKILRNESTLKDDLEERIRKRLTLTEIIVLEEKVEELPEMTEEMWEVINNAFGRGNDNEVLAQVRLPKDTISITRGDLRTLRPAQWLNDNVINTYLGLIVLRSQSDSYPRVYAFQTFFYPKLLKEGYSNMLKRWTRKDDIFAHDMIILPIHLGLHWCLACIDLRKKTIKYYDSLGGDNDKCLHLLLEYISREMKERKQIDLNKTEWTLENVKGIPQQENGSDCGMFSCKFAEYLSRDATFTFNQENMPYYRNRMVYELINANLMYP